MTSSGAALPCASSVGVAVCYSLLQCVAVCCSVLQCVALCNVVCCNLSYVQEDHDK